MYAMQATVVCEKEIDACSGGTGKLDGIRWTDRFLVLRTKFCEITRSGNIEINNDRGRANSFFVFLTGKSISN